MLSPILGDAAVARAARGYTRVLIRVPEAYVLVRALDVTRPALVVLDADGNTVEALPLAGIDADKGAERIAEWLTEYASEPALTHFRLNLRAEDTDAVSDAVEALDGVEWASEGERHFEVEARAGTVTPAAVLAAVKKAGAEATMVEPLPVRLTPRRDDAVFRASALEKVAGVLGVKGGERPTAWVAAALLDPTALRRAAPGFDIDVTERTYTFDELPGSPSTARVALAPLDVPGVRAVFPSVADARIAVVGRQDFDDAAVRAAFQRAGRAPLPPRPEER